MEKHRPLFIGAPPVGKTMAKRTDCKEIWKRLSQEIKEQDAQFINFK
jgi:hypothetical protein